MASGSCAGSLAKFILLLINLNFILASLGLILFGSRLHLAKQGYELALDAGEASISWTTIATGCIITGVVLGIISLFGFGAALCESSFLLNAYAYFLMACVLLVGSLYVYVSLIFTDQAVLQLRKYYRNLMNNYTANEHSHMVVEKVQRTGYCCGDLSPEDWHNQTIFAPAQHNVSIAFNKTASNSNSTGHQIHEGFYPISCCDKAANGSGSICPASELVFTAGCFSSVQVSRYQYFMHAYFIVTIAAILLLLTISCCLQRDHELQQSKMINLQYAAHLETCRGGRSAMGPPSFLASGHYSVPGPSAGSGLY